jgi:hypothetical protein
MQVMKKGILLSLLFFSGLLNAQSLKEALYGGKLKNDSGSVVRKTDDIKSKIDTTKKKPVEVEKPKLVAAAADSSRMAAVTRADSVSTDTTATASATVPVTTTAPPRTNTQIWKAFIDSAVTVLKREIAADKKIKSETYYVLVDYDINEDGQVVINNATPDPMDRSLQEQIRQTLEAAAPKLTPAISNGKPKKVSKKYNFILTKE